MAPSSSNLKKNKNGGTYVNGKSLPLPLRKEIVQRFKKGERVVSIGRSMKLTHGVVSKITRHYKKTGSFLPRNMRSPPPTKMPFTVDAMLDNTIKPNVTSALNPIPENAPIPPVMPNLSVPSVAIIPPLQAIQMAQLLKLQSSLSANQWHPVDMLDNSAAISKPVATNPPEPSTLSNPTQMNVTTPPTVPNLPISAVQIIPPPEIAQFAHLQQLQWLIWMNSADLFRL